MDWTTQFHIGKSAKCWRGSKSDRTRNQPRPGRVGPRRSSQKAGLMKDRADRLAQLTKSQPEPDRLGRRRSDRKVCAPPP